MPAAIVAQAPPHRLITDGAGNFAVIEARAGRVYSLHGRDRNSAEDTPEGMAAVVEDGWSDEATARRCFEEMRDQEEGYSRNIW